MYILPQFKKEIKKNSKQATIQSNPTPLKRHSNLGRQRRNQRRE